MNQKANDLRPRLLIIATIVFPALALLFQLLAFFPVSDTTRIRSLSAAANFWCIAYFFESLKK